MENESFFKIFEKACNLADGGHDEKAFRLFMRLAATENSTEKSAAMGWIATMYSDSKFLPQQLDKSIKWDTKAIQSAGDYKSFHRLAITYKLAGDMQGAKYFYEKALASGYDDGAALDLAKLYNVSEKETPRVKDLLKIVIKSKYVCQADVEEAQDLLEELELREKYPLPENDIEPEENHAQVVCGESICGDTPLMHQKLLNVEIMHELRYYRKAFKGFKSLAETYNNPKAMDYLGHMYRYGEGVCQDYEKSIEWYQRAISLGHVESLVNLAILYRGTPKISLYKFYLERAMHAGSDKATLLLAKLYGLSDKETQRVKALLNQVISSESATVDLVYEAEMLLKQMK